MSQHFQILRLIIVLASKSYNQNEANLSKWMNMTCKLRWRNSESKENIYTLLSD